MGAMLSKPLMQKSLQQDLCWPVSSGEIHLSKDCCVNYLMGGCESDKYDGSMSKKICCRFVELIGIIDFEKCIFPR